MLIYLAMLGLSRRIWVFSCDMDTLSCPMWDLVPWPGIKRLLISWLQSPSAVILEPKKIVCVCLCSCILQHCCTLISSHVFFVTFIRFSTCSQICDLQIMTALFHYQSECLYFFSLPISLANPTSTMLNRSSESRHSGFVPDFMYSVFLSN